MREPFFPNPAFGWTFYAVLLAFLCASSVVDLRQRIVPKWISLPLLGLGVLFNLVRGYWMGSLGDKTWQLEPSSAVMGTLDGFLFALAGFATGFCIFFLLWTLGLAGGGDVKLHAAVGAWVGPWYAFLLLVVAAVFLMILSMGLLVGRLFLAIGQGSKAMLPASLEKKYDYKTGKVRWRGTPFTYSFALAIAVAIALPWWFRYDLQLAERPQPASSSGDIKAASPQRQARTSDTISGTCRLVLAWRCGLAGTGIPQSFTVRLPIEEELCV